MNGVPRTIKINPCLNGYICQVGCQTLVFNEIPVMLNRLECYLKDPDKTEQVYRETAIHRGLINTIEVPPSERNPVLRGPTLRDDNVCCENAKAACDNQIGGIV